MNTKYDIMHISLLSCFGNTISSNRIASAVKLNSKLKYIFYSKNNHEILITILGESVSYYITWIKSHETLKHSIYHRPQRILNFLPQFCDFRDNWTIHSTVCAFVSLSKFPPFMQRASGRTCARFYLRI